MMILTQRDARAGTGAAPKVLYVLAETTMAISRTLLVVSLLTSVVLGSAIVAEVEKGISVLVSATDFPMARVSMY